jgi:pimeloyl-ACP methyl ester carboxylesterase
MKNTILFFLLFLTWESQAFSQIKSVGHRTITFNDPGRTGGFGSGGGTGRQIQTEVYYPSSAATDGDSTAFASGQYPVLVFGHGFVMAWSSYDNIWKDLVPQGYIVCFPRTEGGTSPSHTDFGKDLALIPSKMFALNTMSNSPFFNTMTSKSAIMGHSMGGGSAFLACAGNTAPTTMITFAAATTNPSSIAAAPQVTIPTLVIAGQNDCVAPPAKNQDSMYVQCGASCKAEITIHGASHCEFANSSSTCSFGQGTCSPQPTISAAFQHSEASLYYSNWLRYWLKNDCAAWNTFHDSASHSTVVTAKLGCSISCTVTGLPESHLQALRLAPNPGDGRITLYQEQPEILTAEVFDGLGRMVATFRTAAESTVALDLSEQERGLYFIVLHSIQGETRSLKFIRN